MKRLIFIFILLGSLLVNAQSVSLLNKPLNDAIRRAQLWGDVPISSSFCIRPVDAAKALGFDDAYALDPKYDFVFNDDIGGGFLPKLSIPISKLTDKIQDSLAKHIVNKTLSNVKVVPDSLFCLGTRMCRPSVALNCLPDIITIAYIISLSLKAGEYTS